MRRITRRTLVPWPGLQLRRFFPFKLNPKEVFSILQFAGEAEQRVIAGCRRSIMHKGK